jgi:uncharacterized protein YeaO (DUF488 family)
MNIELKRVYDDHGHTEGYRVLVDRLWPRGIAKTELPYDEWLHDLAPSTALRKKFGHDPARWDAFRTEYLAELKAQAATLARLRAIARKQRLVLLYGAKDEEHNQAVVLRDVLQKG